MTLIKPTMWAANRAEVEKGHQSRWNGLAFSLPAFTTESPTRDIVAKTQADDSVERVGSFVDTRFGNAFLFDGVDYTGYWGWTNHPVCAITLGMAIEFLIWLPSTSRLATQAICGTQNSGYSLRFVVDGSDLDLTFWRVTDGGYRQVTSTAFPVDQWVHGWVEQRNPNGAPSLYLNGKLNATGSVGSGSNQIGSGRLGVGGNGGTQYGDFTMLYMNLYAGDFQRNEYAVVDPFGMFRRRRQLILRQDGVRQTRYANV